MPNMNPEGAFRSLKQGVIQAISQLFPVEGQNRKIELVSVDVTEDAKENSTYHIDNIESQFQARAHKRTWGVPVKATFRLIDKNTSKVIQTKTITIAKLPKMTKRYSYIVKGHERQVDTVMRLKAGVYHGTADNGEVLAKWNMAKGKGLGGFNLHISDSGILNLKIGPGKSTTISLYSMCKILGASDAEIKKYIGKELTELNSQKYKPDDAIKVFRAYEKKRRGKRYKTPTVEEAVKYTREKVQESEMFPEVSEAHLGTPYKNLSYEALLKSAARLIKITKGEDEGDDRQSLSVKTFHSIDDFIVERITKKRYEIQRKVKNLIDKEQKGVDAIVGRDLFNPIISKTFEDAQLPKQTNPLEFVSHHTKATILGQAFGGIAGDNVKLTDDKLINPSHIGFLDPLQTPESAMTGLHLHIPLGATKEGNDLVTKVYDVKAKKIIKATPVMLEKAVVAYPDQVILAKKGNTISKVTPKSNEVVVYDKDRRTSKRPWNEVQYVLLSSKQLFASSANLIPFLQNNNGNRAMMASKHQEQAIALAETEQPLVQSKMDGPNTFEDALGHIASIKSKVEGIVDSISKKEVIVKTKKGKLVKHQLYDHYPLGTGTHMMNSKVVVKKGDPVKKYQVLADSNFTDKGRLSIGKNLRVAYMPYKGYNFEDGIVVSETAASKLTSEHLHNEKFTAYKGWIVDKMIWRSNVSLDKATPEAMNKLNEEGIIKEGETVTYGDILIAGLAPSDVQKEHAQLKQTFKNKVPDYIDKGIYWKHDYGGKVVRVVKSGKNISVYIKTNQKLQVGDKLSGRHGNKGIITKILPDHEMPKDSNKEPVEILYSPAGVPSRMNVGQILETCAGKIAKKTGKPFVVDNFDSSRDYSQLIKDELKKHNIEDTEELFDAKTGKSLGKILTGFQYTLKLEHQSEKKVSARSAGSSAGAYTDTGQPARGSGIPGGGKKIGQLDSYALLAHGAKHNLREMQTWKSDKNQDEVWYRIMLGLPLPTPQVSTSMNHFQGYLKAMGINVEKKGDKYSLAPLTDKQVKHMSNGELTLPGKTLYAKGGVTKEERYGLFDPDVTGGLDGKNWSHISLTDSIPNPIFEKAIASLMGISVKDLTTDYLGPKLRPNGKSGFDEIRETLEKINVKEELKTTRESLKDLKGSALNKAYAKTRYLKALDELEISPVDAYLNKEIPVLPPIMRPIKIGFDNTQIIDDFNYLYLNVGQLNDEIKEIKKDKSLSKVKSVTHDTRSRMYDAIKGLRISGSLKQTGGQNKDLKSLMDKMAPKTSPKNSFFQSHVVTKRQDLSARSVIIPEPELTLDEVGVPQKIALEIYKPFLIKKMLDRGYASTPIDAIISANKSEEQAIKALEEVMEDRPVLLKRDPVLHKFGILAFKPKLVSGNAIQLNPLVCGGFNADFDGDAMNLYVPVSDEAVEEAKTKMMPSKNLFSPTHGGVMPVPSQDAIMGLYHASKWGKDINKTLSREDAVKEVKAHKIKPSDIITVNGKKTTAGRIMLADTLPKKMQNHSDLLYNPSFRLTKGTTKGLLKEVAKKFPNEFPRTTDGFKSTGYLLAYHEGSSMSLNDFHDGKTFRDELLHRRKIPIKDKNGKVKEVIVSKEESKIRNSNMSSDEKDEAIVALYSGLREYAGGVGRSRYKKSENRMYDWVDSGARSNWDQFGQLVFGPMLVQDAKKKTVPIPLTTSFGEGLPISEYWASLHGARKGTIDRASGTADPGSLTKDLINTVINQHVTEEDCGTVRGAFLETTEPDIIGRFLAKNVSENGVSIPKGTLLGPRHKSALVSAKVNKVIVRSPLYCEAKKGVCGKCYGLNEMGKTYDVGVNVGIIAGHALGEPVTQMQMRTFHTGGAVDDGLGDYFQAAKDLFNVPQKLKGSAALAKTSGIISNIEKTSLGVVVHIGNIKHKIPAKRKLLDNISIGTNIKAGDPLTDGRINPQHLLKYTGNMNAVRNHLTNSLMDVYVGDARRRNIETVIKSMTNISTVQDPAKHPDFIKGQHVQTSEIEFYNKKNPANPIMHTPVLKPLDRVPVSMQEDWMARLNYRYLKDTFIDGASQNWSSDIHGHPIAGLAHGAEFGLDPKKDIG